VSYLPSKHTHESGSSEPELEIIALKSVQKGHDLYTTNLIANDLWRVAYTLPKSRDEPKELERQLTKSKVAQISAYVDDDRNLLPNNIIVNLTAIDHIELQAVNEKLGVYKLRFTPIEGGASGVDADELPLTKTGKFGYVVDGQHRGVGTHQSRSADSLPLVVTLLWNVPQEVAYKTFADINDKQKKVSKLLTTYIRREISDVDPIDAAAFDIAVALNDEGVLKDRVKIHQDDKQRWVNSPALVAEIHDLISADGVLHPVYMKGVATPRRILEDYFSAWKETFPTAWGSSEHILTKGMGFAVMLRVFERVYRRCDFFEAGQHSRANMKNQLQELKEMTIDVGGNELALNWESVGFAPYSSGAGINALVDAILAHTDFQERPEAAEE
jgi:DGQHR domain-containing protein